MSRKTLSTRTLSIFTTLFLLISLYFSVSAQEKSQGQKVLIGGKTYTLYTAVSGDSPFSIARKFGISPDELNNANPEIKGKLNLGQTVKIPVAVTENKSPAVTGIQKDDTDDGLFSYHSVRRKETVFSIAQKSEITSEDIYHFNPQARDGVKEGDVLKIPKPQTSVIELKAKSDQNKQKIKYVVGRRETLFSIARKYNTTQEEILEANPTLKGVLSKGTVLIIPENSGISSGQEKPEVVQNSEVVQKFSEYRIEKKDNYFQLEKRFGISQAELEQLNPMLKNGFNTGMIIRIPIKKPVNTENTKVVDNQLNNKIQNANNSSVGTPEISFSNPDKIFQIGVFLPFCQNLNDSIRIAQRTTSFLEFYSGVLLAAEKMTEAGMKLKLFTYDTYQDNKEVEKLVKKPEFLSLDLIIGPVYPENQKTVAELSAKNHIPMISPLSSDSRFVSTTPGYYQINPGKNLRLIGTADYIAGKFAGQNIIVLNHGTNSGDEKLIIDRMNQKPGSVKVRQYNIWDGGTAGLEALLKAEAVNIVVLTEGNEANVSVAMTRLNTISKSNKITVIGLQEYTKMQSIDIEYLHNINLHFLSPYFIDYGSPKVNTFIEKYRAAYNSEPTQYSFQGYDIALHFIASLGKSGKNFPSTNPAPGVDLLQADYSFQKLSDLGGYMNQTLYVIEYTNSYDVRSTDKIRGEIATDNGKGNGKNGLEQ